MYTDTSRRDPLRKRCFGVVNPIIVLQAVITLTWTTRTTSTLQIGDLYVETWMQIYNYTLILQINPILHGFSKTLRCEPCWPLSIDKPLLGCSFWDCQIDNDISFTDGIPVLSQNKDYSSRATASTVLPLCMVICTQKVLNIVHIELGAKQTSSTISTNATHTVYGLITSIGLDNHLLIPTLLVTTVTQNHGHINSTWH